jgi:uncharacterized protein
MCSASAQPRLVRCPMCGKSVAWIWEEKFRPFCSERCKLIDLGEWVWEEKRIPAESITDLHNGETDS